MQTWIDNLKPHMPGRNQSAEAFKRSQCFLTALPLGKVTDTLKLNLLAVIENNPLRICKGYGVAKPEPRFYSHFKGLKRVVYV